MSKKKSVATKKSVAKKTRKITALETRKIAALSGTKKAKTAIAGSLVVFGTPKSSRGGLGLVKLGSIDSAQDKAKADVASNIGATQSLKSLLKSTGWS
jgi:hypothetical protein